MEDLLIKVLFVIEHNMNNKLKRIDQLIKKNKYQFNEILNQKDILQGKIMKYYCLETSEIPLSQQISFMFKILQKDVDTESQFNFEISKTINNSNLSLNVFFLFFITFDLRFIYTYLIILKSFSYFGKF